MKTGNDEVLMLAIVLEGWNCYCGFTARNQFRNGIKVLDTKTMIKKKTKVGFSFVVEKAGFN